VKSSKDVHGLVPREVTADDADGVLKELLDGSWVTGWLDLFARDRELLY